MSKTKIETLDLDKELLIRIGNENDDHIVSWDILKNIGDKLEDLILTIARYNPDTIGAANFENFKLDFSGFYNGSAIPAFKLNSQPIPSLFINEDKARQSVIADFTKIVRSVDKGNYQEIVDEYTMPSAKNDIIKKVYEFTNSAGTIPVSIVKRQKDKKFRKIYSIRKLDKDIYNKLIIKDALLEKGDDNVAESTAVARVIIKNYKSGKASRKTFSELYEDKEASYHLSLII